MCVKFSQILLAGQHGNFAPSFLKVLPKIATVTTTSASNDHQHTDGHSHKPIAPLPDPTGSRFSRRVRGMNDGVLYDPSVLELVEGRRKSGFKVAKPSNIENAETLSPSKNTEHSENSENNSQTDLSQENATTATTTTTNAELNNENNKRTNDIAEAADTAENGDVIGENNKDVSENQQQSDEMDIDSSVNKVKRSLEFDNTSDENLRTEGIINMLINSLGKHSN